MNSRYFFFFILTACILSGGTMGYAQGKRQAIVMNTQGQVDARLADSEWQEAKAGMVLHEHDEIRTGKESTAEILLDEGGKTGKLDLNPESRMRLSAMTLNQTDGAKTTILDLAIGSVLVEAEKLQGASKFQVRTPNSTTGVRGTKFLVSAAPKDKN